MNELEFENERLEQNVRENNETNNKGDVYFGSSFAQRAFEYDLNKDIELMKKKNPNYTGSIPHQNRGELTRLANEISKEKEAQDGEDSKVGKETLGYSSDHYKWEMEQALKSGNQIWYENAKRHYGEAKARETLGEGEAAEGEEALGYSSEMYNLEMKKFMEDKEKSSSESTETHKEKLKTGLNLVNAAIGGVAGYKIAEKLIK